LAPLVVVGSAASTEATVAFGAAGDAGALAGGTGRCVAADGLNNSAVVAFISCSHRLLYLEKVLSESRKNHTEP
jgi:hypothetical protein